MKVLDLECRNHHVFEGWFASEDDFQRQCGFALVECPVCGDGSISKRLSAPRLNLGAAGAKSTHERELAPPDGLAQTVQQVRMAVTRHLLATTEDVGENFAEEARKIHYGEIKERDIRGQASRAEVNALVEEGINVMPLPFAVGVKGQLH